MNNKHVAVLLNKVFIRENLYLYVFNRVEVGRYDEEYNVFYDRNDNEYYSIKDKGLIYSEIPYAYGSIVEMGELKKIYCQSEDEHITINEAIKIFNLDKPFRKFIASYGICSAIAKPTISATLSTSDKILITSFK